MVREDGKGRWKMHEISAGSNVSGWECAKDHAKLLHQH